MNQQLQSSIATLAETAPKLAELTQNVLFADIWERPELSKRERSLITVAALIAMNRSEQLPFHLERAQQNGISRAELAEVVTHLAFYSGWPAAASAITVLSKLNTTTAQE